MYELREQFLGAIHPGTIPMLARRLQAEALKGDLDCTRILLDWCLGKPTQAVELTGADGEPLGLNIATITQVVLTALADDPAKRIEVAARLMELDGAGADD